MAEKSGLFLLSEDKRRVKPHKLKTNARTPKTQSRRNERIFLEGRANYGGGRGVRYMRLREEPRWALPTFHAAKIENTDTTSKKQAILWQQNQSKAHAPRNSSWPLTSLNQQLIPAILSRPRRLRRNSISRFSRFSLKLPTMNCATRKCSSNSLKEGKWKHPVHTTQE